MEVAITVADNDQHASVIDLSRNFGHHKAIVLPILLLRALPFRLGTRKSVDIETTEKEHTLPDSLAGRFVKRGLQRELRRVRDGRKQWLGTSVLVVARKSS